MIDQPYAVKKPLKEKLTAAKIVLAEQERRYCVPYRITLASRELATTVMMRNEI